MLISAGACPTTRAQHRLFAVPRGAGDTRHAAAQHWAAMRCCCSVRCAGAAGEAPSFHMHATRAASLYLTRAGPRRDSLAKISTV
jgi:hypothetical protein